MAKRLSLLCWAAPALLGALIFALSWPLASDQDLYLHLKSGEDISLRGGPTLTDSYAYTAPGAPEETHSWLSQWALYKVRLHGGETGLRILNGLCVLFLFLAVFRFVWRLSGSAPAAGVATALAVLAQSQIHTFRPVVFGQVLAAILLFLILAPEPWTNRRGIAACFVSLLWANLHGSALLAPALVAIRTRRPRWILATFLVQLANPKGPGLWLDTMAILDSGRTLGIGEWTSASFPPILWIAAAGTAWLLLKKGREDWTALAAGLLCLVAFSGHRHLAWLFFPIAAAGAALARSVPLSAANAALGIAVLLWGGRFWQSPRSMPPIHRTADFLLATGIEGNCFNHPGWGAYLSYRLDPKVKIAHNMRLFTHREIFLWEKRKWDSDGGIALDEVTAKWPDTRFAVLPSYYPIPFLADPAKWGIAYANDQAAVLLRRGAEEEANWERVERYYKENGVPFDRKRGFLPRLAAKTDWLTKQEEPGDWGLWPDPKRRQLAREADEANWKQWLSFEGVDTVLKTERFYWKAGPSPDQGKAQP